ncbi:hypothetical protein BC830DRAFT_132538 [Chytriomyces sp. MP71]|nr:hypothetical protein BC830DRAFT_132538 [Chytriomyces sp. MP71]
MQPAELPRVALSNADIQRKIPRAHLHLYDPTTLQCAQCAARFPGTNEAGRKQNSAHLDWHFRQNKKMRERGGRRAVCREWYLDEDTWVKEDLNPEAVEVEVADKAGDLFGLKEMDKKAASEVAEVVVQDLPAEEAGSGVQCGICREPLEQYYNDEEDMWMIKGAVKVDGVVRWLHCAVSIFSHVYIAWTDLPSFLLYHVGRWRRRNVWKAES